jgi:transcriptional regulator with XRE-family HTH domain
MPNAMNALFQERIIRGLSLLDIEDRSGVSFNSMYSWRGERCSPTLFMFVALAESFGFEVIMRRKS